MEYLHQVCGYDDRRCIPQIRPNRNLWFLTEDKELAQIIGNKFHMPLELTLGLLRTASEYIFLTVLCTRHFTDRLFVSLSQRSTSSRAGADCFKSSP
jgi:hypothetical protein